jgi:hypothetical protein
VLSVLPTPSWDGLGEVLVVALFVMMIVRGVVNTGILIDRSRPTGERTSRALAVEATTHALAWVVPLGWLVAWLVDWAIYQIFVLFTNPTFSAFMSSAAGVYTFVSITAVMLRRRWRAAFSAESFDTEAKVEAFLDNSGPSDDET